MVGNQHAIYLVAMTTAAHQKCQCGYLSLHTFTFTYLSKLLYCYLAYIIKQAQGSTASNE